MNFTPYNFVDNLRYMGIGMLTIFVIIGIVIAVTVLLSKIKVRKDKDGEKK